MSSNRPVQPIQPGEGYDIDSSAFDSEDELEGEIPESELDQLVEEGPSSSGKLLMQKLT